MSEPHITKGQSYALIRPLPVVVCLLIALVARLGVLVQPTNAQTPNPLRRVNAPYFDGEVRVPEMAIFWFGQVNSTDNYADVGIGYNDRYLRIRISVFDRYLWYDTTHSSELAKWDGATLYLDLEGDGGSVLDADDYRFIAQLNAGGVRDDYQMASRGDGSSWVTVSVPFTTTAGWRGDFNNNGSDHDDRGWVLNFYIPFASLGLSGPPADGTRWGLAFAMHDRDNAPGSPPIADKRWPEAAQGIQPITWGRLMFNLPSYQPPSVPVGGTASIRHNLEGATVTDASVGGYAVCGQGVDFWTEWGYTNEAFYNTERSDFNIQNQTDVADWPCFSKYYVTFPLDSLLSGKVVLSATLTLHQFGNAGGPGQAEPSLIQVLTVAEDWDEATLAWNNAPLAVENVATAWVNPIADFPGWPGVPRVWDVSRAVAEAYVAGEPLRLALYQAYGAYHSGKYFVSSNTGDWNAQGRPTLTVSWGQKAQLTKSARSVLAPSGAVSLGSTITYTLRVSGSGQPLTVTDVLPARISHPLAYTTSYGSIAYDPALRKLTWRGAPSTGQSTTIVYPVTVTQSGTYAIVNVAHLTAFNGSTSTASSVVIVEAKQMFLPCILRWK